VDEGLFDALPNTPGEGLVFAAVAAALVGLWWLVKGTRLRHLEDLRRRREEWKPPPEPDDPSQLPPRG
jgi:hypothetical protein